MVWKRRRVKVENPFRRQDLLAFLGDLWNERVELFSYPIYNICLFVLGFWQFNCDMSMDGFICTCFQWSLQRFLNMWLEIFHSFEDSWLLLLYITCFILSLLLRLQLNKCEALFTEPFLSPMLVSIFFILLSLCFSLDFFFCPFLWFTHSLFSYILSAKSIYWVLNCQLLYV